MHARQHSTAQRAICAVDQEEITIYDNLMDVLLLAIYLTLAAGSVFAVVLFRGYF